MALSPCCVPAGILPAFCPHLTADIGSKNVSQRHSDKELNRAPGGVPAGGGARQSDAGGDGVAGGHPAGVGHGGPRVAVRRPRLRPGLELVRLFTLPYWGNFRNSPNPLLDQRHLWGKKILLSCIPPEVSPIKCDVRECVVRTSYSLENLTS